LYLLYAYFNKYKHGEIEIVEKNTGLENLKGKDEIFNTIHTAPADEQQFEKNSIISDNTKLQYVLTI